MLEFGHGADSTMGLMKGEELKNANMSEAMK
jgi:hypothetical protein